MPELPEVETVRRTLEPFLVGRRIEDIIIHYGGIIKKPEPLEFIKLATGQVIRSIKRRGKYLLFQLGVEYTLVIHLRMTGQLTMSQQEAAVAKHTHLIFRLDNGRELRFTDIRKFGMVYLIPTGAWHEAGGLVRLGPEPLDDEFTAEGLCEIIKGKKGKLKAFLLDQTRIAGIGNIYADEIMFAAGLSPQRQIETLSKKEMELLYAAIRAKLQEGVEYQGTSIRDYVNGLGEKGGFQHRLKVYDCAGQQCERCGTTLIKANVCGRGTVFCPQCQH